MPHERCSALDGLICKRQSLVLSQKQNDPRSTFLAASSLVTALHMPLEGPFLHTIL